MVTFTQVQGILNYCGSLSRFDKNAVKFASKLKYAPLSPPAPLSLVKKVEIPERINAEQINGELLGNIAEIMHTEAKKDFKVYYNIFKNAFKNTGAKLCGRTKCPSSIYAKLDKRKSRYLTDIDGTLIENAYRAVPDLNGYKLVSSGKTDDIDKIFKQIENLVESNELTPSHFFNYGKVPYLTAEHVNRLESMGFYVSDTKKKSGFSCVNMYFIDKNDKKIELQIIGDKVDKINKQDHLFYNFNSKGAATENGIINEKYQKLYEKMSSDDIKAYSDYIDSCYYYSRILETGYANPTEPYFPKDWDKALKLI